MRETVGLITLREVVETLLGQPIASGFDDHDILRAVADRHSDK